MINNYWIVNVFWDVVSAKKKKNLLKKVGKNYWLVKAFVTCTKISHFLLNKIT